MRGGGKFLGESYKFIPQAESAPHPRGRARVQFFEEIGRDMDGGRGYLGSFRVCFEGNN